jgi:MYXO-CTERM domain-containing protein
VLAVASLGAAVPAGAQERCQTRPGLGGLDQYCETVPGAGGDRGRGDRRDRGERTPSGSQLDQVRQRGGDGQTVAEILERSGGGAPEDQGADAPADDQPTGGSGSGGSSDGGIAQAGVGATGSGDAGGAGSSLLAPFSALASTVGDAPGLTAVAVLLALGLGGFALARRRRTNP